MLDFKARQRFAQSFQQKNQSQQLVNDVFSSVAQAAELKKENKVILDSILEHQKNELRFLDKLGRALVMIHGVIPKSFSLPKIFPVRGEVKVLNMPDTRVNLKTLEDQLRSIEKSLSLLRPRPFPTNFVVDNLFELKDYFDSLERRLSALVTAISQMPQQQIKLPKIEIPKQVKTDNKELVSAIESLNEKIAEISAQPAPMTKFSTRRMEELLEYLVNRPNMVANPVTNVSINPMRGVIKSTDNTVGTTLVTLPNYGALSNRRAILIYNNSANTIYVGDSNITTTTGMPVPTLSYSPILDASYSTLVYGIASQGGNDVRVMEISDEVFPAHPQL